MSKLFDLLDILKGLEDVGALIEAQKGTIKFVESRLQNLSASDDEERLKSMGEASAHDLAILEPHYADLKEKYKALLELAKSDVKVLKELETLKIPDGYKDVVKTLKQDLDSKSGYEKSEE